MGIYNSGQVRRNKKEIYQMAPTYALGYRTK